MVSNQNVLEITQKYGNRVRLRACGLCWKGDHLLVVNHKFLTNGDFWAPPGGGVEFGQSAQEALVREFREETNLTIKAGDHLFTCEFIKPPLHAIELFFEAFHVDGELNLGSDPESTPGNQIIADVAYLSYDAILRIPTDQRHGIFRFAQTPDELRKLTGFYRL